MATHLILPGWWLDAFAAAGVHEGVDSAMTLARAARLAPAMTVADLNGLVLLLSCLQQDLLAEREPRYAIRVAEHVKHTGSGGRDGRFNFEKQMQLLSAVRLLHATTEHGLGTVPLFAGERWFDGEATAEGALAVGMIELAAGPLTHELVLGVADPHYDLARTARGELTAASILGERAPTAVWRSLWLELPPLEQQILLRLELALQEDRRWLSIEGVVGLPLDTLFAGIKLPEGRAAAQHGELAKRLKMLVKLGKRLGDHGFLAPAVGDQYLAFGEDDAAQLMVIWQIARERLAVDAAGKHVAAARRFLLKHRLPTQAPTLCSLMPGGFEGARRRLDDLQQAALSIEAEASVGAFTPALLLWEIECRTGASRDPFPLPEVLQAALSDGDHDAPAGERLAHFMTKLDDSPELIRALNDMPFGSYASAASLADRTFSDHVQRLARPSDDTLHTASKIKPRLVGGATATDIAGAPVAAPKPMSGVSGALTSRMRRIANDELGKMRHAYPERYVDLKRAYLASLDETGRKLMLEVQRRMQPGIFEEHLKQRLVKFMVERPSSWRSSL